jgi:ADP-heptose:LPS heptosyltransferase
MISHDDTLIGIYCSAYGNSRHWGFWDYSAWRRFLAKIHSIMPDNVHYLFIGAEYDLAISDILHGWMQANNMRSTLALGDFHIGATVELIRNMDYLFAFPSGLAFLADVVNTPNTTWLPGHMEKMRGTFVDPVNYADGRSYHGVFNHPEGAFEEFKKFGLRFVEERQCKKKI